MSDQEKNKLGEEDQLHGRRNLGVAREDYWNQVENMRGNPDTEE